MRAALYTLGLELGLRAFVHRGEVVVELPDGRQVIRERPGPVDSTARVQIHDWNAVPLLLRGGLGFAKAYGDRRITVAGDLGAVTRLSAINAFDGPVPQTVDRALGLIRERLGDLSRRNTVEGQAADVATHYDTNDLAEAIGATEGYTCGLYSDPRVRTWDNPGAVRRYLIKGQTAKFNRMLDLAGAGTGTRLGDLGCGWGQGSIMAARRGARVNAVTLSHDQAAYVRRRIKAEGDRIADLITLDEANIFPWGEALARANPDGLFDGVISIEVEEAFGRQHLQTHKNLVYRLLKPRGRFGLQVIVARDNAKGKLKPPMPTAGPSRSWVNSTACYPDGTPIGIFPHGYIPSWEETTVGVERAGFEIESVTPIGEQYRPTLSAWRQLLHFNWEELLKVYPEKLLRLRDLWLTGCDDFFNPDPRIGRGDVLQIAAVKPA